MWNLLMIVVIASLTGLYAAFDKEFMFANENVEAVNLAKDMAIYREAVITYFDRNPGVFQSVDLDTLIAADVLPSWSTLYARPRTPIWTNYRDTDGMIYVYASSLPTPNVFPELVKLTQSSVLMGVYRAGDTTLYSPALGDTKRKLPPATSVSIPEGSPVWIAVDR